MHTPLLQAHLVRKPQLLTRRMESRFDIQAPCRFWWQAETESAAFGAGRTFNVSVCGVSVNSPVLPAVGSFLMLEIDLPRAAVKQSEASASLLMNAEATVVRHHAEGNGFAAVISYATLVNQNEGISQ